MVTAGHKRQDCMVALCEYWVCESHYWLSQLVKANSGFRIGLELSKSWLLTQAAALPWCGHNLEISKLLVLCACELLFRGVKSGYINFINFMFQCGKVLGVQISLTKIVRFVTINGVISRLQASRPAFTTSAEKKWNLQKKLISTIIESSQNSPNNEL